MWKREEKKKGEKYEMHVDDRLSDGNGLGVEEFTILARLMEF